MIRRVIHVLHGLPCIRLRNDGSPCRCETAWEEAS